MKPFVTVTQAFVFALLTALATAQPARATSKESDFVNPFALRGMYCQFLLEEINYCWEDNYAGEEPRPSREDCMRLERLYIRICYGA